jgi:RNA polymerase sigma-70 factor (ECF subfamily)
MNETQFFSTATPHHLIEGCIRSDRSAQAKLYELYAKKMLGVCIWYARNKEEAEEILQDGFLRVFRYISKFSGKGSFEGWVRKIMVNAALQKIQRTPVLYAVVNVEQVEDQLYYEDYIFSRIEARELLQMVQTLPPAYRSVFNLHVFEGMKHREIAELLHISEGTSKSNLSDARSWLRKALEKKQIAETKHSG